MEIITMIQDYCEKSEVNVYILLTLWQVLSTRFACINSYDLNKNMVIVGTNGSLLQLRKMKQERFRNLNQVTQLVSGRAGLEISPGLKPTFSTWESFGYTVGQWKWCFYPSLSKHLPKTSLFSDDLYFIQYIQVLHEVTYSIWKHFTISKMACTYRPAELIIGKRPYLGMMGHM